MRIFICFIVTLFSLQASAGELWAFSCGVADANGSDSISGKLLFGGESGFQDLVYEKRTDAGTYSAPVFIESLSYSSTKIVFSGYFLDKAQTKNAVSFNVTSAKTEGQPEWNGSFIVASHFLEIHPLNCADER